MDGGDNPEMDQTIDFKIRLDEYFIRSISI